MIKSMTALHVSQLIIEYRYWIIIPLAIIEGPIVAFVAGTLASLGYFNIYLLVILMFIRDLGLDGFWYALGYWGGRTHFVKKMLAKVKVTEDHMEKMRTVWEEKPLQTMFIGKLSYGIAGAFIVAAGAVKMSLTKFFKYGAIVTIAQYGTLLALGYFLGNVFGASLTNIIQNILYIVAIGTLVLSTFYIFSWYMRGRFIKREKEVEMKIAEKENRSI